MPTGLLARYVWASPATAIGLLLAALLAWRGRVAVVAGVVEASGPLIGWALRRLIPLTGGAAAITLGHVVLGRDERDLAATRAHERVHVRQYERWGPFFVPGYAAAAVCAALSGDHPYYDNPFERAAFAEECRNPGNAQLPDFRGSPVLGRRGVAPDLPVN